MLLVSNDPQRGRWETFLDLLVELPGGLLAVFFVGVVIAAAVAAGIAIAWWAPLVVLGPPVFFGVLIANDV